MANAEDDVLVAKQHPHGLVVSPAFAVSRFTNTLVKALKGNTKCVECAYVRQMGYVSGYLKYMVSIIKLGKILALLAFQVRVFFFLNRT